MSLASKSFVTPILLSGSPGTNGQVLTSRGPGQTPHWTTVSGGGGDLSTAVILNPGTVDRNAIVITGDQIGLSIEASLTNTESIFECRQTGVASTPFYVKPKGQGVVIAMQLNDPGDQILVQSATNPTSNAFVQLNLDGNGDIKSAFTPSRASDGSTQWSLQTSVAANNFTVGRVTPQWKDNTDGATLGLLSFGARDVTGLREFMQGATDGANPLVGFLGAAAVAQQPTASTAGIAAIRTDTLANAVADIKTILTALRAWAVTNGLTNNTA